MERVGKRWELGLGWGGRLGEGRACTDRSFRGQGSAPGFLPSKVGGGEGTRIGLVATLLPASLSPPYPMAVWEACKPSFPT